jgi:hypothetical protein
MYHVWALRNEFRILIGKHKVKRPLGRPICRWGDSLRMDPKEIRYEGVV